MLFLPWLVQDLIKDLDALNRAWVSYHCFMSCFVLLVTEQGIPKFEEQMALFSFFSQAAEELHKKKKRKQRVLYWEMGMFKLEVQTKYAGNTEQSSLGNSKYMLWVIFQRAVITGSA